MAAGTKYLCFTEIKPDNSDSTVEDIIGDYIPEPRSGHRIVVDHGNLYSIGGYNPDFSERENDNDTYYPLFKELWRFNFATCRWQKLKTCGTMPVELASHSALLHGNHLVLFGGTGVPFGEAASNQLHVCHLPTLQWSHIFCTGQLPICIYGHTMTVLGNSLYVFGGTTGWEYNSDLHRLDLSSFVWDLVEVSGVRPDGRYRHEVASFGREMFVFGGGRSNEVYGFEAVPVIDVELRCWTRRPCVRDSRYGYPAARRCHSCVQLGHVVYVCGGYNGHTIFGDLWMIDLLTMQWTRLPAVLPEPVYFHSAGVTSSGLMVVHGGVVQIDTRRSSKVFAVWLQVPPLKELCWQALIDTQPAVLRQSRQSLLETGVPPDLVARLG